MNNNELAVMASKARLLALEGIFTANAGHPGGSLSCLDALSVLYFDEMKVDPQDPRDPERDRFVMSKGHCAPALYGILALKGYFPTEDIKLLRSIKGHMSGHPDMEHVAGVDMSTGSLGQGVSAAVGMALAAKRLGKSFRTYVMCGDGEIEEGQVWEAFMAGAKWKLDNLCVFIDVNGLQIDGATADVMPSAPLKDKLTAFNWHVIECPGHDYDAIKAALAEARACKDKPTVILLKTTKGKNVSYMENSVDWHGKAPNAEQYAQAKAELEAIINELEGK